MSVLTEAKRTKLREQFQSLDDSGDGELCLEEFAAWIRSGNSNITDKQIQLVFRRADKNGNGKVAFDEFCSFVYKDYIVPVDRTRFVNIAMDLNDLFPDMHELSEEHHLAPDSWGGQPENYCTRRPGQSLRQCVFHSLAAAVESKMADIDGFPVGCKFLNSGFPFILQALGIRNKNGDLYAEHGGDLATLVSEINHRDIVFTVHPSLAYFLGESDSASYEAKCTLTIKGCDTMIDFASCKAEAEKKGETGAEDFEVLDKLHRVQEAVHAYNKVCNAYGYTPISCTGGRKICLTPDVEQRIPLSGIVLNCAGDGSAKFVCARSVKMDSGGTTIFECPTSTDEGMEQVPSQSCTKVNWSFAIGIDHLRIRKSAQNSYRTWKAMMLAKRTQLDSGATGDEVPMSKTLRELDFSLNDATRFNLDVVDLSGEGFSPQELRLAGFFTSGEDVALARKADISCCEMRSIGCDSQSLRQAGYSATEQHDAGFELKDALHAGYSLIELRQAGPWERCVHTWAREYFMDIANVLAKNGYANPLDLVAAGYPVFDVKAARTQGADLDLVQDCHLQRVEDFQARLAVAGAKLHLNRCALGPDMLALAAALRQNSAITELCLIGNNLEDDAGELLASSLRKHPALVFLSLALNSLGNRAGLAIAEMLKENRNITSLFLYTQKGGGLAADVKNSILSAWNGRSPVQTHKQWEDSDRGDCLIFDKR